jgi:hypothetical protein
MTEKPGPKPDPFEHEIERALKPGAFIPDRTCFEFVSTRSSSFFFLTFWKI